MATLSIHPARIAKLRRRLADQHLDYLLTTAGNQLQYLAGYTGSNGLLLLPHFAGILNPDCNPAARGVLFGIGLQTSRSHVVRAILESVGYMLRDKCRTAGKAWHGGS